MKNVGYIRVSTVDQNESRQLDGAVLDEVFTDKTSGSTANRPALQEMIKYVRKGDIVHIHSIDRLARNLNDLHAIVNQLKAKDVAVRFHKENLEFSGNESNTLNNLMFNMLGAFAQFERDLILERQREGIAKAKEAGKYKGRKKTVDVDAIKAAMKKEGASFRKVAKELNYSLSTVQRAMK